MILRKRNEKYMNYVEIIRRVLENGTPKQATRYDSSGKVIPVENGTIGTFCEIFEHDMSSGTFPLTTIRKMPFKQTCQELEFFISGKTDKQWLLDLNNKYWKYWANPIEVNKRIIAEQNELSKTETDMKSVVEKTTSRENTKKHQEEENDLGPIGYSWEWRKFGQHYIDGNENNPTRYSLEHEYVSDCNGVQYGFDQLKSMIDKLKKSPYDRRMVTSFWNPNQLSRVALPSCHLLHQAVVYGDQLNLSFYQRSCDLMLNQSITTYALLMLLLCEESGLKPGKLMGVLADCHIYDNQIESAKILATREEKELPSVKIKRKEDGSFSIFDWSWSDIELIGYNPHPSLDMGKITV